MWMRMSLRTRILVVLSALVAVTIGGGLLSILHGYLTDRFVTRVTESGLVALQAAQELENAICMQKGFVTYYFQDSDPIWLKQLDEHHLEFEKWLKTARMTAGSADETDIVNRIESQYVRYSASRAEVVTLYKEGKKEAGFDLHKKVRYQFLSIIELCNEYKALQEKRMAVARGSMKARAQLINLLALMALFTVIVLAVILVYTLLNQILGPLRQLALETDVPRNDVVASDEVQALSRRFHTLIADVDQTRSKLQWSREHLEQAEKWALVGKLAAGVAHSVRNPLTSVKMRLFSMERTLALSPSQKEDLEVISEEIGHIDTIVGNFLEFSRPPKLKMQKVSPSDSVDMAVQLLHHRLESYDVKVHVKRNGRLPEISADPDQLKEVLVNLMVNACDAMVNGGKITIEEEQSRAENVGRVVILRVSDNGPGVPESIQAKLFQPFFSTKEEGTGLGLSIATRIVEEHGGWLDLKSQEGQGATFIITLPAGEE